MGHQLDILGLSSRGAQRDEDTWGIRGYTEDCFHRTYFKGVLFE